MLVGTLLERPADTAGMVVGIARGGGDPHHTAITRRPWATQCSEDSEDMSTRPSIDEPPTPTQCVADDFFALLTRMPLATRVRYQTSLASYQRTRALWKDPRGRTVRRIPQPRSPKPGVMKGGAPLLLMP
jgi:hypothetical protein